MSRQRLSMLITGKVKRVRRRDLKELARVLGVTEEFLGGGPASSMSGAVVREMFLAGRTPDDRPGLESRMARTSAELLGETRQEVELTVLMSDLDRVFPLPANDPKTSWLGSFYKTTGHHEVPGLRDGAMRSLVINEARARGTKYLLELDTLRAFIAGTREVPRLSNEELDDFAGDMSSIVRKLFEPWILEEASTPPGGARILAALASIATGLINLTVMDTSRSVKPSVVEGIVSDLERVAARLDTVCYERFRP
ncbi:MAG TPA: hypothetical protein VMH39_02865, partial [Gemmatimonadaceae bacterium]|nr:hypothetical protein [Gemmatimonadaceae bacterium]